MERASDTPKYLFLRLNLWIYFNRTGRILDLTISQLDIIYYNYKAEKPSIHMSAHLHFWHADNSAGPAVIKWHLIEIQIFFEDHTVFCKPSKSIIHWQDGIEDNGVNSH